MGLLTITQDACDRLGLPRPSAVIGSSDTQTRQFLGLAQQEGKELARRFNWQALARDATFVSIAAEAQTGVLPEDFDRFVGGTFYNRSATRIVTGPLTPQEYADYKGRLTSIVYDAFRLRGNTILILPTPSAGWTFAFEYITKNWCTSAGGDEPRAAWQADDDEALLDDEAMTLGLIWRFMKAKGLDYGEAFQTYQAHVQAIEGRDGGTRILTLNTCPDRRVPRAPIAPDGNWPLS